MTTWDDVRSAAPDLATRTRARFDASGLALVATLRRDGSPRISGVEPFFGLGQVWLGMMPGSRKAQDLQRDGRCALHSATVDTHLTAGDAKISAVAVAETDADARAAYNQGFAAATGNDPTAFGEFPLFRLDVTGVTFVSIAPEGDAMVIEHWRPGAEVSVIRRT